MTRRHGVLLLQSTVTVALLVVVFRGFDWAALAAIGNRLSLPFYVGSFAALVAGQLLYAWRWNVVLDGMGLRVPYSDVLRQYLIGLFLGNLMPTAVGGDAAKVYYLGRRVGFMEAGASVLVDRLLGFFWLSVIGATLSWTSGSTTPLLVLNRSLLTAFAAAFVVLLGTMWLLPIERVIPDGLRAGRWSGMVARLEQLAGHVRAGGCRPFTLLVSGVVVLTYVVLLSFIYREYFGAASLVVPGWLATMNVLVSMSVFVNVPVSVGGIGLREQLHYLLFNELGITKEASVSLSLLIFSYSLLLSLVGYVIWLRLKPVEPVVTA